MQIRSDSHTSLSYSMTSLFGHYPEWPFFLLLDSQFVLKPSKPLPDLVVLDCDGKSLFCAHQNGQLFGQAGEKISCGKWFLKNWSCFLFLPVFLYYYFLYRKEIRKEKRKSSLKSPLGFPQDIYSPTSLSLLASAEQKLKKRPCLLFLLQPVPEDFH